MMQLQYVTAIVAIVLVSIHLLMQGVLVPYCEAVSFQHVLSVYRSWSTARCSRSFWSSSLSTGSTA